MKRDERHVRLRELRPGRRRRCVLLAIGITWLSFIVFLLCIASWAWLNTQPSDAMEIATLVLIATSGGISHGTHAKLKLQNTESGEFVSEPSAVDVLLLALSSTLVVVAGCIAIATSWLN